MSSTEYKLLVQEKVNRFRAMHRIVESPEFHECLTLNPNDYHIKSKVELGDIDGVKKWLQSKLRSEIMDYTARQLRSLAAGLGIKDYCSKTKAILLSEIIKVRRAKNIAIITQLVPLEQSDINTIFD